MAMVGEMQMSFHNREWQRYDIMLPNCHMNAGYEMDILCLRKSSWYVEEIEIKTSKSDYNADFRKTVNVPHEMVGPLHPRLSWWRHTHIHRNKHDSLKNGNLITNYFSFLITEELEEKIEVPEYYGLYVYRPNTDMRYNSRISQIQRPKLLHKNKPVAMTVYKWARKMSFRYWDNLNQQNFKLQ